MEPKRSKKIASAVVVAVNLVLAVILIVAIVRYLAFYQNKLYDQNLKDISNINQAAASVSSEFFRSQENRLRSVLRYLERHSLPLPELLAYLNETHADDETSYQLIGMDYTGYLISGNDDGTFDPLDYSNKDYREMQQIFDAADTSDPTISFSATFTDQHTGIRSFARYTYVSVPDASGAPVFYTLMAVSKSAGFIDLINIGEGYDSLSTVLINESGSYILGSTDFKSENFFEYLYLYNELTLDEMNAIKARFSATRSGSLLYQSSRQEDCVFVYSTIPLTDWYSVSCVPIASFHTPRTDLKLTVFLLCLLGTMMTIDFLWLGVLNKRLKNSVRDAQTANDAKTDFLSRMSHDIRTPINVITGMTDLALSEHNPPQTDAYLTNIQASNRFLLGLVNDILDMNKVESGKMELHPRPYTYAEFHTYINAVIAPLCAEKSIHFITQINDKSVTLIADSLRLNQILFNLLSNAVKFTDTGGHIRLVTTVTPIAGGRATVDFLVEDDGIGMSQAFQDKMFDAFSQERNAATQSIQGTGLGLAIVKSLVELMGGTIRVESRLHVGTTFFVHLETARTADAAANVPKPADAALLSGKRMLLCEDHPLNAQIMVRLLARKAVEVDVAENGQRGLELFSGAPEGHYDAILMDIRMPVMDGLNATRAIRTLGQARHDAREIPIIALTANAFDADVQNCLDAGMNAHLAKPIEPELLYATLSEMLQT